MRRLRRITQRATLLVLWALLAAGCAAPPPAAGTATPELRPILAPTGTLRIAVYPGSPTSMVRDAGSGEMRGLAVELGRDLAARLAVPAEVLVFDRAAEVVAALKSNGADFTVTNATPARANDVDFTPPLVAIELGYLTLPDSPVQSLADADRAGVRIGVSMGSTSQSTLTRLLQQARLVPAPSLDAAGAMLRRREIDAFATNKAILHELADAVPGARVLPGRWGLEHLAVAVPKGRSDAAAYLREFVTAERTQGRVGQAAARAGLRGLALDL